MDIYRLKGTGRPTIRLSEDTDLQTIVPPPPPSPAELVAFAKGRVAAIFAQLTEPADPAASDIAVANRQSLLNDQLTEAQDTLARARQLAASR